MGKEKKELKILIADDNEKDRKLLELKLLQLDFPTVVRAADGMEALELARKHLPDLLFLDIIMPGADGGKVKEQLEENPETNDIPTIFISSIISKDEEKRLGGLAGGHIIIAKPFSSDELLKAIDKALANF